MNETIQYKDIPIVVIGGPTAVGKTGLSIQLAQHLNGEIINGDSMQVYTSLNIGTGKVTQAEMSGIRHHLLDIRDVTQSFDAYQFKQLATDCIVDIHQRGKLPIIVGGTGLYLEGLLYNLEFGGEHATNAQTRQHIIQQYVHLSDEGVWHVLKERDALAANKIPYQNRRKVLRALEVIQYTGELFSNQTNHEAKNPVFSHQLLCLNRERSLLYERINARVEMMIEDGLEQEAWSLYCATNHAQLDVQSTKGIGYKEWWAYFEGRMSKEDVVDSIQKNSRHYAKRQLTWFRNRFDNVHWLDMHNEQEALQFALLQCSNLS